MTLTPTVLTNADIYLASADLSGFGNNVQLQPRVDVLDRTTFSSGGAKEVNGGLSGAAVALKGFWQAGDATMPDDMFWTNLGATAVPLTVIPSGGAVGDLAYLTRVAELGYTPGGQVGQNLMWSADLHANWPVARGQVLHPQGTARTSSGNGTGVQLGAVDANHALYVTLHVLFISGTSTPTITVSIQDSVDNTFASPHTTGTFTAATALGGQTLKVAGGITNTWYRATWTISGSSPSFLFNVSAGIGPKQ